MNYEIINEDEQYVNIRFINTSTFKVTHRYRIYGNYAGRRLGIMFNVLRYPTFYCFSVPTICLPGTRLSRDKDIVNIPWRYWPIVRKALRYILEAINNNEL